VARGRFNLIGEGVGVEQRISFKGKGGEGGREGV
jgi:hypothetical protein